MKNAKQTNRESLGSRSDEERDTARKPAPPVPPATEEIPVPDPEDIEAEEPDFGDQDEEKNMDEEERSEEHFRRMP